MTIKRAVCQLTPLTNKDSSDLYSKLFPNKRTIHVYEDIKEKDNHSSFKANKEREFGKFNLLEYNVENITRNPTLNVVQNNPNKGFFLKLCHNKAIPKLDINIKY